MALGNEQLSGLWHRWGNVKRTRLRAMRTSGRKQRRFESEPNETKLNMDSAQSKAVEVREDIALNDGTG